MSTPSDKIANQAKNCSFNLHSIKKFLSLMAIQQKELSDISYKANGPLALILKAKKNGIEEVALKVLECTDHTDQQIQAMEREYAICKQLPFSDYFVTVQSQFYLTEMDESSEQDQSENINTVRKVFFVRQMEMCQGSLHDTIQDYSEKNKDPPTEEFKELLAIQMLDAVNLLHLKHIAHGNITLHHFLVSYSQDYPVILKLSNLRFTSPVNSINLVNQGQINQSLNIIPPMDDIQKDSIEQDLVSLGKVLLQLDSIGTQSEYLTSPSSVLAQPELATMFENNQLDFSTFLSKIACSLSKSKVNNQCARSMLMLLLQKQTKALKIPLFSIVLKNHLDSLRLPISPKRIRLDFSLWQTSKQHKLLNIANWFNTKRQRNTQLTVGLLKSALDIMLEWKEFSGQYDVLGVGVGGVVFGVENLKEKRKSALKLSLCTNKADTIREIGIMRICQARFIIKFYQHKFFQDASGNEFVVYELERCKYSLIHHLELQRLTGEYSDEQKNLLTLQIIDSISFLHENRILHRNLKIDSFLVTEDESGQAVAKLGNFSHAVQLQDNYEKESTLEYQLHNQEYLSQVNCIFKKNNRESPLYFAPERWVTPDLSTYLTDSFSVGLCIFLLESWLVCSEEQLVQKLLQFPLGSFKFCQMMDSQISRKLCFKRISKQLLMFQPKQRTSIWNLTEKYTSSWKESKEAFTDLNEQGFQQQLMLNLEDSKQIDDFKQSFMIFSSLYCISLNLKNESIGDDEVMSILNLFSDLHKLSKISIDFKTNLILLFGAKTPLSPLAKLTNLFRVSLCLHENVIRDIEAKCLLSPLTNFLNLSSLNLDLNNNKIGELGAQSLLFPLANLFNLSSLRLDLNCNKIGDLGAQSLLSPLANLLNLSNLNLNLNYNIIGELGAQSLLFPLANLFNLSSLRLDLNYNKIENLGASSLLSPLANLLNLSNLNLDLNYNKIGDFGAQSLLLPLANLLNLSNLNLDLNNNRIEDLGVYTLLFPLKNLLNLSSISLDLDYNNIGYYRIQSLLFPLANLLNLSSLRLDLNYNKIGNLGAFSLLSPLANLLNLSNLSLDLNHNDIGDLRAQSLLSPLANLLNLSNLSLDLNRNDIGYLGAQSLLSPIANLLNLSNLYLYLNNNAIGCLGAQSLLSPIANLLNLSNFYLNLNNNTIGDLGAQSLLSPLSNLVNLSSINLELNINKIGGKGAQSLLSPLANIFNLSSLKLNLNNNVIEYLGGYFLLSPLENLLNLSTVSLSLFCNKIHDMGAYSLFNSLSNLINLSSLNLELSNNRRTKKISHLFKHYFFKLLSFEMSV